MYAKYHKELGAILGIEIVGEMPQRIMAEQQRLEGMKEGLAMWTPPSKEKPYWTRKDVTLTKTPNWEWKDEPDTNDTVPSEEQPLSGESVEESTSKDSTGTASITASAFVGYSAGSKPPAGERPDSADPGHTSGGPAGKRVPKTKS